MNDTGLFSGIYEGIRNQADLLDRVLVQLKAGTSVPENSERQQLAAWLVSLADPDTTDYSARMIRLLLRGQRPGLQQGWAEIGESLLGGTVGGPVIDRLEELARALEREQATALARLRGES
jgi:hypothetical protein